MDGTLRRARVHVPDPMHQRFELRRTDQVGLADKNLIRKADLSARFLAVIKLAGGMLGVDECEDGVEQIAFGDLVVHEKCLGHWPRVGDAGSLDHHPVEVEFAAALLGREVLQGGSQVFTDRAADAAIAHLNDLFGRVRYQNVAVDVLFAEFIFDHGDLLSVRFGQNTF